MQEASFSADWGDYISFAHHLRKQADDKGIDLLLVDTGDRIEGNGLYDASDPKGKYTFDIFKQQQMDVICSGNHELYKQNSSENEFYQTVPNAKGNYLASNIDIHNPKTGKFEPLAKRWRKFTTKNQGIRVTAFGFLFNFQGNYNNTRVQPVQDTIKEKWFQDAIQDKETDLFLVAGHVAVRSEEFKLIYQAIRAEHWDTPIQFFGGHVHVRDYKKYDRKAAALASGRYMETIGFMSIDGLNSGGKSDAVATKADPTFHRLYIDNNLFSLQYHSQTNSSTFSTKHGANVTKAIADARAKLNLDQAQGCAPQDLWMDRAPVNDPSSIFQWLKTTVLPEQLRGDSNDKTPKLILTNTGAVRFNIFKGPFTKDTESLVSPFTSGFRYLKEVDYSIAIRLIDVLNRGAPAFESADTWLDASLLRSPEQLSLTVDRIVDSSTKRISYASPEQMPLGGSIRLTPGYTTVDDDGDEGDDTVHEPISFYSVPNCIQSKVGFKSNSTEPEAVDVVYNEFLEPFIIQSLQFLGGREYGKKDTRSYKHGITLTDVMANWIRENWPCKK